MSVVQVERDGPVAIVTINRPERRNALNLQVKQDIGDSIHALEQDSGVAVIVLTGAGGYFVAGTDVAEMASMTPMDHVRLRTDLVFQIVRQSSKPVIAAVEGYALGGGCELALACDLVIAADDARFGQPEIKVGIMPGAGGTQRLLRTAGRHKALLWSLTGEPFSAHDAWVANVVSEVVPKGQALSRAIALGRQIAQMPPLAVSAIREAIRLGADVPLETGLSLERRLFERLFDSADQKEGMNAFLEKRPAQYRGE
ncbi:MAG TPA: enoyl-CoA hydratase/isomerase family protein [Candidatus Aquabacterium excrementipullorum]|nr:enoyl-CoA hydratase/isomerase family protein [Candidatus Aquabacterium excrementipullorum]